MKKCRYCLCCLVSIILNLGTTSIWFTAMTPGTRTVPFHAMIPCGMNTCGRNAETVGFIRFGFKFSINLDPKGKENNLVIAEEDSQ